MSWVITQQPDAVSLSSILQDLILTTEEPTDIDIKINGVSIITETYTPDSDDKIYIRDIGKLVMNYLAGSGFDSETQSGIVCTLTIDGAQDGITSEIGEYLVMLCNAMTDVGAAYFFDGKVFLHILTQKKHTIPTANEYLTVSLSESQKVKCFVTTSNFENSAKVDFYTAPEEQIKTLDVSFNTVKAFFPAIDPNTIIAYRIELEREIAVYMVDRSAYLCTYQFRFLNYFGVPETIITRGNITRKSNSTFEKARIGGIDNKFNTERSDVFSVDAGKLFTNTDVERFREFFDSENVEIYFAGKWIKVIVEEGNNEQSLRLGNAPEVKFTFAFADIRYNSTITGSAFSRWILENGQWIDNNVWVDTGHWNDN